MGEYTPDTEEVRRKYVGTGYEGREFTLFASDFIGAEFDRWLQKMIREAHERGYEEGYDDAIYNARLPE